MGNLTGPDLSDIIYLPAYLAGAAVPLVVGIGRMLPAIKIGYLYNALNLVLAIVGLLQMAYFIGLLFWIWHVVETEVWMHWRMLLYIPCYLIGLMSFVMLPVLLRAERKKAAVVARYAVAVTALLGIVQITVLSLMLLM